MEISFDCNRWTSCVKIGLTHQWNFLSYIVVFTANISQRKRKYHTCINLLLLLSWISGSVISSHPGTQYMYEPMSEYGLHQIRDGPDSKIALDKIQGVVRCNYTGKQEWIELSSYTQYDGSYNYITVMAIEALISNSKKLENRTTETTIA